VSGPFGFAVLGVVYSGAITWFLRRSGLTDWYLGRLRREGAHRNRWLALAIVVYVFPLIPFVVGGVEAYA
jgi:hypothetical protein